MLVEQRVRRHPVTKCWLENGVRIVLVTSSFLGVAYGQQTLSLVLLTFFRSFFFSLIFTPATAKSQSSHSICFFFIFGACSFYYCFFLFEIIYKIKFYFSISSFNFLHVSFSLYSFDCHLFYLNLFYDFILF
jgi:hypothetical protein